MKLSRFSLILALALPSIAIAQTVPVTPPNTVDGSGRSKAVGTTFIVNADGSIATIGGNAGTVTTPSTMVTTTQGTAANGGVPAGNPNLVAGSDGANVRTMRTDPNGILLGSINNASASNLGDGSPQAGALPVRSHGVLWNGATFDRQRDANTAAGTTGTGLAGTVALGLVNTTQATATAVGNYVRPWLDPYGRTIVQFVDSTGNNVAVRAPADGAGNESGLTTVDRLTVFNGATWDRLRGDTTGGLWSQERERAQFYSEPTTALAANATYTGATRDGGPNISQWGSFSCFARADQSGSVFLDGSPDNVTWTNKVTATVAANTPVRITDRNDMRNSRCRYTNGATANTAAPVINSSFGA